MNIIEAIKSGKRYKRKAYREWYRPASPTSTCYSSLQYSDEDILADDWEVEEKTVTITKSQLESACRNAVGSAYLSLDSIELDSLVEELQKELGL